MKNFSDFVKNSWALYISVILLSGALLFLFLAALCKHGWLDEHITIMSALVPWDVFCQNLSETDVYPPLHYFIEGIIGRLSHASDGGIRVIYTLSACQFFSMACFVMLLSCGVAILKKYKNWSAVIIYVAVLCSLPMCDRYCMEARAYMMCVLILFATFICACYAFKRNDKRWWAAYSLSLVLLAYTNYYALLNGIVLTGVVFIYAFLFARHHCVYIVIASACALVCFIPWMPYMLNQIGRVSEKWWGTVPANTAFEYIVEVCGVPLRGTPWFFFVAAVCMQGYALCCAVVRRESLNAFIILCGMIAVPCSALLQVFISLAIDQSIVCSRYCIFPIGIFVFSLSCALCYLPRFYRKSAAFLCACMALFTCHHFFKTALGNYDIKEQTMALFLLNYTDSQKIKLYVSDKKLLATVELLFEAYQFNDAFCLCYAEGLSLENCIIRYGQYKRFLPKIEDMNLDNLREGDTIFVHDDHMKTFERDMKQLSLAHQVVMKCGPWNKVTVSASKA